MAKKKPTPNPLLHGAHAEEGNPETPTVKTESDKPLRYEVNYGGEGPYFTSDRDDAVARVTEQRLIDTPQISLTDHETGNKTLWYKEAHQKNYRVESTKA